ncbi:MAG TPA: lactamase [Chloroflexi bacterium]|nr:lactamase [Chloroflexota bacterium]
MEITWYGHSCFRIRDKGISIVTDPYDESIGYSLPPLKADIVTVSHHHPGHSNWKKVKGKPKVLDGPGEYEVKGVFITGIATYHDRRKGRDRGKNVVFLFEFDGMTICHLGDLGHILNETQVEALTNVDVLLIPVGGVSTLTASEAAEVIRLLEPSIVIPMHYRTKGLAFKLNSVTKFFQEMGISKPETLTSLKLTKQNLPAETRICLLEQRQK